MGFLGNYKIILEKFYKDFDNANFNSITKEQLEKLKEKSIYVNRLYNKKQFGENKSVKYIKILEKILCSHRTNPAVDSPFTTTTKEEMYLLFLLSIDSDLEAAKIFGSFNKILEIKYEMEKKLGIFDIGLVRLEKIYMKTFLTDEKRKEIEEEIENRSFK